MALTDKDILITPNDGSSTADPKTEFVGADSSGSDTITLETQYNGSITTLSFDGSAGQLFSISNDLSGTIFSVNDNSGIPSIEVDNDGEIRLAEFDGNVGIGVSSPAQKLHVKGSIIRLDASSASSQIELRNSSGTFRAALNDNNTKTTIYGDGNGSYPYITMDGADVIIGDGTSGQAKALQLFVGSHAVTTDNTGLTFTMDGTYSDGRYEHRFRKQDVGGGIPLYIDKTDSVANSHTALVRFGGYTNNTEPFEVYGNAKVDELIVTDFVRSTGNNLKFSAGGNHILNIDLNGKIYPNTHNAYDIGFSSSTAFRHAYFSGTGNFANINTGQGATEVHLMNQNLRTTDSPTFATLNVTGDLNITGDINTTSVSNLDVVDKVITIGKGGTASGNTDGGIIVDGANAKLTWNNSNGYWQMNKKLAFNDTATTTNQGLGIIWSGFDKESTGDFTDNASIVHTTNAGGISGSVLLLTSQNDSGDGIAFVTNGSSNLMHNSNKIWTAGNDGSGSGLDADTLDGINSGSFLRSDTADTATGRITLQYGVTSDFNSIGGTQGVTAFYAANVGGVSNRPDSGNYATGLEFVYHDTSARSQLAAGSAGSNNQANFYVRSEAWSASNSWTSWYKLFHTGNDGSGSGLDADLLDGQHGSYYAPASGANYVPSGGTWMGSNFNGSRHSGLSVNGGVVTFIRDHPNTSQMSVIADGAYYAGENNGFYSLYSGNSYNNSVGFYADTSGNLQWNAKGPYAQLTTPHGYIQLGPMNTSHAHIYTDRSNFYFNKTVLYAASTNNLIWHAGNDGSGSGLDADLLDGYDRGALDHAEAYKVWTGIDADSTQAKRRVIARLYGCPGHWNGNWQNIEFTITAEYYESAYMKYRLMGNYGNGSSGMLQLHVTEAAGPFTGNFKLSLGSPVDAGWDSGGQDVFYQDLYADAMSYGQYKVHAKTYGHGFQNSNPTSGTGITVFYDSPAVSNISNFSDIHGSTYVKTSKIWNAGNDGSGSGLDADLLDGQHASAFAPVGGSTSFRPVTAGLYGTGHGNSILPIWQYNSGNPGYGIGYEESSPDRIRMDVTNNLMSGTPDFELIPNELRINGNKVWNAGNDGASSGLDADLLDGQHGSYYLDYNNFSNTPTIPSTSSFINTGSSSQTKTGILTLSGGLIVDGSTDSGGTDMGFYQSAGTNIVLKGDSNGRSGIFFQSEKNGTNINHPSDYGFIQFHPYGYGSTSGESADMVIGTSNDAADQLILQVPYKDGVKVGYRDTTSGTGLTQATVLHTDNYTSTLDSRYIRQGGTYSLGSAIRFQSNDAIDTTNGTQSPLEVFQDNAGEDAFMAFHISGDYAAYFGLDGASNDFVFGGWSKGAVKQRIFHDGYHPNADKWTTSRTLTLSGDVTGSTSWDGSGNATITTAVGDDSHNHNHSDGDFTVNGHLYGRSVNNAYSNIYRMGGVYFTWDSDSYGTNTHHSIRSTYGDTYGDDITLNSYHRIRMNIDSNNNNGLTTEAFEIGHNNTGTSNTLFRVDGNAHATLGYDGKAPNFKMIYDDNHASGDNWDTVIELGRIQDKHNGSGNYPTYQNQNGYGLYMQSNSDGCFWGMEEYTTGNYRPVMAWGDDTSDSPAVFRYNNGTKFGFTYDGTFHADGNIVAYSTTVSDIKHKENITTIENAIDKVKELRGVEFDWKATGKKGEHDIGFIAQEVEKVLPELVSETEMITGEFEDTNEKSKSVAYGNVTALLVEAVKEQQQTIEQQKNLINRLEERLNNLEKNK